VVEDEDEEEEPKQGSLEATGFQLCELGRLQRRAVMEKPVLGQMRQGIRIVNRINGKVSGVYVGRPSLLGNPFRIGPDGSREQVVEKYRVWLREQYRQGGAVKEELRRLAHQLIERRQLTLICHCVPKRCHAEVIRDAIIGIVQQASGR